MKKARGGKARSTQPHPLAQLAQKTLFSVTDLDVLKVHHQMLDQFCVVSETEELRKSTNQQSMPLSIPFDQYCLSLATLIKYGGPAEHYEYLFHTYATDSEQGISRAELFEMLQDHFVPSLQPSTDQLTGAGLVKERHFERIYTWLKKHMIAYDKQRIGALPLRVSWGMLESNPLATRCLQIQVPQLIARIKRNNERYRSKAEAAELVPQRMICWLAFIKLQIIYIVVRLLKCICNSKVTV